MSVYSCVVIRLCIDVSCMFLIHLLIHRNSRMIKEEQRIKQILNKYRRQEDKGREKDNKRKQTQKTTLTPLRRGMN